MAFLTKQVSGNTSSVISFIALAIFLPLLLIGVYQTATLISRASGTPANITLEANRDLQSITLDWIHAFAQGGEESVAMLPSVISETKALKPKLIRIDHIYDHYSVVGRSGSALTYDFSRLDEEVNAILATGAKPLLSLSYMPSAIAKDGSVINPPNDWNEWSSVIRQTVEHYSGRGNKNIAGVYYEVWNEPDLAQFGSWKAYGDKNYMTLYRYAVNGATSAANVNQFSIGGPSTTGLYKTWILALVQSGARVDFFSWHTYQADPKKFVLDQENIADWLMPYPTYILKPKLITEFGFTGAKSKLYNTTYAAAHTAAVVRQLINLNPAYLFSFEIKDGPNQTTGDGWGLLTHQNNGKKPKPRYGVYSFLDRMTGTRLALSGEGSWVTGFSTRNGETTRLLLVNFDASGSHVETVPITVTGLPTGTYSIRQQYLFGQDTSVTESIVAETPLVKQIYMPAQSIFIMEITKTASATEGLTQPLR